MKNFFNKINYSENCERKLTTAHRLKLNVVKNLVSAKAIFVLAILQIGILTSCKERVIGAQTEFVFGTVCTINLFSDGTQSLYEECFGLLSELDDIFNVNESDSEISVVNQNGGIQKVQVSKKFYDLLEYCMKLNRVTKNCFCPVLGSVIDLWGIGTNNERVPHDDEIENALECCRSEFVELTVEESLLSHRQSETRSGERDNGNSHASGEKKYFIHIKNSGTKINLGAIVKGYATDELVKIFDKHNVKKAVIDLGGNIYVYGKKENKNISEKWKVGIKNPIDQSKVLKVLELDEGSVVTSGNYERFFVEDGKTYGHIIDSATGKPTENNLLSVTVVSDKSVLCDGLSTAFFVAGLENADEMKNEVMKEFGESCSFLKIYFAIEQDCEIVVVEK